MSKIGLARGTVYLTPYQTTWLKSFKDESERIKSALGDQVIEHVGSTAVPGIMSKPIIDIAVLYSDKNIASSWIEALQLLGYEFKGEQGVPNRFFFVQGPENKRTYYLHVVDETEFKKLVTFRDRLIGNSDLAREYSTLKVKLAQKHNQNRAIYTRKKDNFIQKVIHDMES